MATYTIDTMFLVTAKTKDGNEVGACGTEKEEALATFKKQHGSDLLGLITILEIDMKKGTQISIETIYPESPELSFLDYLNEEECVCVKTECEQCNIELPLHPAFKFQDYRDPGFYMPENYEYIEDEREAADLERISEQLGYIAAASTNTLRVNLLKAGLR